MVIRAPNGKTTYAGTKVAADHRISAAAKIQLSREALHRALAYLESTRRLLQSRRKGLAAWGPRPEVVVAAEEAELTIQDAENTIAMGIRSIEMDLQALGRHGNHPGAGP